MRPFSSIALLLTVVAPVASQSPPRCDDPKYRQLDFWVGDWNVTSSGKQVGTNLVTREESGCLVHEHWTGAAGSTGQSFNFYDRSDGQSHQVWVSSTGTTLFLSGQYADGKLVYSGVTPGPQGVPQQQRLTFFITPTARCGSCGSRVRMGNSGRRCSTDCTRARVGEVWTSAAVTSRDRADLLR